MIESDDFVKTLQDIGFDFFTGVPDSILAGIIATLMERRLYTPAVREDEAVAMAAGAYMAGRVPAVLMQNSGLGTSLNTLISLNLIYRQPCLLVISWRGFEGKDAPEHLIMGAKMQQFLDLMEVPSFILGADPGKELVGAIDQLEESSRPVAVVIRKGVIG